MRSYPGGDGDGDAGVGRHPGRGRDEAGLDEPIGAQSVGDVTGLLQRDRSELLRPADARLGRASTAGCLPAHSCDSAASSVRTTAVERLADAVVEILTEPLALVLLGGQQAVAGPAVELRVVAAGGRAPDPP